jgi:ABC-type multidrug transport system ATPase subunit
MADLMIEANNLRRTFKEIVAVEDSSFSVQHDEIYGLLGPAPPGCGGGDDLAPAHETRAPAL